MHNFNSANTKNITALFQEQYERPPSVIVAAPGRVNIIGEHIDYNDGYVLPMAIEQNVYIAADFKENSNTASFFSSRLNTSVDIPLDCSRTPHTHEWYTYVEGVLAGFSDRGIQVPAFDALIYSDVPLGGGLSSSAALEVATATLLEVFTNIQLDQVEKALLCQEAEHRYAGVPCGIMDQFSSVFGKSNALMMLDCQSREIMQIPFVDDSMMVLITNTHVSHNLGDSEYKKRRAQCASALQKIGTTTWREVSFKVLESSRSQLSEIEYNRSRHVVSEIERTIQAAEAFASQDWDEVAKLMFDSHASLRDDFEVSCTELDCLVKILCELGGEQGVYGARMTGGGFGGCTVSLVKAEMVEAVKETLHQLYAEETGLKATSFISRPAEGSRVLENFQLTD